MGVENNFQLDNVEGGRGDRECSLKFSVQFQTALRTDTMEHLGSVLPFPSLPFPFLSFLRRVIVVCVPILSNSSHFQVEPILEHKLPQTNRSGGKGNQSVTEWAPCMFRRNLPTPILFLTRKIGIFFQPASQAKRGGPLLPSGLSIM